MSSGKFFVGRALFCNEDFVSFEGFKRMRFPKKGGTKKGCRPRGYKRTTWEGNIV